MDSKNELYSEAMKNSIKLREVIDGMTQEQAERVSLYYAIGYMGSPPEEIEEAQSWQDQRWREAELNDGKPIDDEDDPKWRKLEETITASRKNGAQVWRYVLLVDGLTFTGEAMFQHNFVRAWDDMTNRPELARAEYGVRTKDDPMFAYTWHTL